MNSILDQLSECIEFGKADINSKHPPHLIGKEGASELTKTALESGIDANIILNQALMTGMQRIGDKFSRGKAFIPNLLISAKAMNAAMKHLKPYFDRGEASLKGTIVVGTVSGDLHDIGKNIVKMVMEGNGWKVVDLGVDVKPEKFVEAAEQNPGCIVGLSALLTTTMLNMEGVVKALKQNSDKIKIFVGGAPLSHEFAMKIGAEAYFPEPYGLVKYLSSNN